MIITSNCMADAHNVADTTLIPYSSPVVCPAARGLRNPGGRLPARTVKEDDDGNAGKAAGAVRWQRRAATGAAGRGALRGSQRNLSIAVRLPLRRRQMAQ